MQTPINISAKLKSVKGAVLVYVALLLTVFIGMAAFAIDIGYQKVARNQLQNAADAGALAGARRMGENYFLGLEPTTNVTTVAQETAGANKVAGENLAVASIDTQIGTWDPPFIQTLVDPFAVQVTTNATFNSFFAPIFGMSNLSENAIACAALSGLCKATPGLPLGIGKSWFTNTGANKGCTQIAVNKTGESCAGWTTLSAGKFDHKLVQAMLKNPETIPEVTAGDPVAFGGGTIDPVIDELKALFEKMKTLDDDGNDLTWTTGVVVYEDGNVCVNPNKSYSIIGFATVKIINIIETGSNKGIEGEVVCDVAVQERGGCFYAGTFGTIPGLVK